MCNSMIWYLSTISEFDEGVINFRISLTRLSARGGVPHIKSPNNPWGLLFCHAHDDSFYLRLKRKIDNIWVEEKMWDNKVSGVRWRMKEHNREWRRKKKNCHRNQIRKSKNKWEKFTPRRDIVNVIIWTNWSWSTITRTPVKE